MRARTFLGLCLSLYIGTTGAAWAEEIPTTTPEKVGLSSAKLEKVKSVAQTMIDKKETAGTLILVARHGKVALVEAQGMMDIEAGKPMQADTIFRIYSMTKPITTVAAMMLVEEGRLQLDDPVSKFLPEFKGLRVHDGKGDTVPAQREITIRDLMRHTSGLTYGFDEKTSVDKLYRENKVMAPGDSLTDLIAKLGKLPLLYQPGTRFNYSVSTDVLGRVVEVVSRQALDEFFQERVFKPLDMKDTGFSVPKDKLARFSACYGPGDNGALKVSDEPAKSRYLKQPAFLSGGGGLVSTGRDYLRFCQMIAGGGELQGTRLLKKETVAQMTSNQLSDEAMKHGVFSTQVGFGFGYSVAANGEYGWGGAASTHFWISPKQDVIVIALQQFMPFHNRLETALKPVIAGAVVD